GKPVIDCKIIPPVEPLVQLWESSFNLETRSTVTVGDIDGDGVPEVVCYKAGNSDIYILDGITGALELTIDALDNIYLQTAGPVIADTDGDGFGEIYVITEGGPVLKCFEHTGALKFASVVTVTNREESPSIADFNGDGLAEVYVGNKIFHSLTGAFITSGGGGSRGNNVSYSVAATYPVAADVLPTGACTDCAGLELICGNTVYSVDIPGATMTAQPNSLGAGLNDGWTSVADMNMDGLLDVVVVTGGNVYMWDPRTGLQMGNTFSIPNTGSAGGRASIADFDNDSLPEIAAGGSNRFVVIDVDTATGTLTQKWVKNIVDGSASTTASAFDFEGDGFSEIVYRDEQNLYIWDGATGTTKVQIQCGSATRSEYPTIVDVDGDGHANIVCLCSPNNAGASGKVKVFQGTSNLWIPTREVMNQHTYSVVNIHDNLAVPTNQQNHSLLPRLNNFLAQTPLRDINWDPILIPVADVTTTTDSLVFTHCDSVTVNLSFCNQGDEVIAPGMDISFYNGDPLAGGTLISSVVAINSIPVDSCANETFTIPYTGPFTLYTYSNDDGIVPTNAPAMSFIECDSTNNWDSTYVELVALLTADFSVTGACVNDTLFFTDQSTISAGSIISWSWDFGNGDSSTVQNPSNVYVNDNLQNVTLIVTSNISCVDTIIKSAQAFSLPVADFSMSTADVCVYDSAAFSDLSVVSAGFINAWNWDFGDNPSPGSSSVKNPKYLYTADGIYTVTLIVTTDMGCTDTVVNNIERFAIPFVDFSPVIVCLTDTTRFTDLSTVNNDIIATWIWNFGHLASGTNNTSFLENPSHVYPLDEYNVTLTVISSNGCINVTTKKVGVYPIPVANFGSTSPCFGLATQFLDSSTIVNFNNDSLKNWIWSFDDGDSAYFLDPGPSHTYASEGTYNVVLIVISNNGCSDTITKPVVVHPLPVAEFTNTSVCATFETSFADSSKVSGGSILARGWDFGDGSIDSSATPLHAYSTGGMYNVTLAVVTDNQCMDDTTMAVEVYPLPTANFEMDPEENTILNTIINVSDLSAVIGDMIVRWSWDFGNGNTDTNQNTFFEFPTDTGVFPVTLIVYTTNDCPDTITISVEIEGDNMFFAPNAFMPNGFVEENRYFLPKGLGIDKNNFEMYIYDRWGDNIFTTKDVNQPWYGTANKGNKLVQQDVYVWIVFTKDLLGKSHTYVGHVSLIH
ncbi:MAG: PKD domain-containing protein, partial [Flavobacteriales bacterium]|nr:PKD domain-containing protein [Flavobacteriales bacterium]